MQNNVISVVIPSLDEDQKRLFKVIEQIKTDKMVAEVIVVDDCSSTPVILPNAKVIRNEIRLGSAKSRDVGISLASSEIILTTDAHIKFRSPAWGKKIVEAVENDPKSIFCPICIPTGCSTFRGTLHGGSLDIMTIRSGRAVILEPRWNESPTPNGIIECVMGGAYAFSSSWYRRIGGYGGIKGWCPTEMVAISLKTRLAGGSCLVIATEMEHEFRVKPPFQMEAPKTAYNKMRLASVAFPPEVSIMIPTLLSGMTGVADAMSERMSDFLDIAKEREQLWGEYEYGTREAAEQAGIKFEIEDLVRKAKG